MVNLKRLNSILLALLLSTVSYFAMASSIMLGKVVGSHNAYLNQTQALSSASYPYFSGDLISTKQEGSSKLVLVNGNGSISLAPNTSVSFSANVLEITEGGVYFELNANAAIEISGVGYTVKAVTDNSNMVPVAENSNIVSGVVAIENGQLVLSAKQGQLIVTATGDGTIHQVVAGESMSFSAKGAKAVDIAAVGGGTGTGIGGGTLTTIGAFGVGAGLGYEKGDDESSPR